MSEDAPLQKQAAVAADEANIDPLAEAILEKAEKGMPTFVVSQGGLWELWASATELSQYRLNRYRDYDDMETDSLIASALELVTDDAVQFSSDRGRSLWPAKGSNEKWVNKALTDLKVEENLWGWIFNTAKYGDFFARFVTDEASGTKSGLKFRSLDSSIHPKDVRRIDMDGKLQGFLTQEEFGKVTTHPPWEFVHFMLNNRPRFERHRLRTRGKGTDYTRTDYAPTEAEKKGSKEVIATSMYGTSWLDPARHVYRVLKLLEQSLALARLNRSPLIRIFYVNTTGMTPKERQETLNELHQRFKKNLSMDMRQNFWKSDYNPLSFNADLFIPITDQQGNVTAETLGGELNIKDIVDVDYQKNKLFAALRIPQAYLGFEEVMPGTIGSTTLVRMDIRYARSVKKLQRASISGVTRLLEVMYALEHGKRPDASEIAVEMEVISGIEELDRMEAMERKLGVASQFLQMVGDLGEKIDPDPIIRFVFDTVLGLKDISPELKIGKKGNEPIIPPDGEMGEEPPPEEPPTQGGDQEKEESLLQDSLISHMASKLVEEEATPEQITALATLLESKRRDGYLRGARSHHSSDFSIPSAKDAKKFGEEFEFKEDIFTEPMYEQVPDPEVSEGEEEVTQEPEGE